jgi:hypothetical protein
MNLVSVESAAIHFLHLLSSRGDYRCTSNRPLRPSLLKSLSENSLRSKRTDAFLYAAQPALRSVVEQWDVLQVLPETSADEIGTY